MAMKQKHEKIAMLTAYDYPFAQIADAAGVDIILVGDSLCTVVQGRKNTIPVTMEQMIYHTEMVVRATQSAMVVFDLPFMSYQASATQALLAAGRALKEGAAGAIKLEGGPEMVETVRLMVAAGIPVIAHIGLRPQRVHQMGGYVSQGRTSSQAAELIKEARAFEEAGAFALLLEGVAIETAREVTAAVKIPTIGIGSGPHCSGQVLVIYDLLGFNPAFRPSFLKVYADGGDVVTKAVKAYIEDVKGGAFPTEGHGVHRKSEK